METNAESLERLKQVREDMRVVDANGDDVGKVIFVHLTDPGAVTTPEDRGAGEGGGDPNVDLFDVLDIDNDDASQRMRQLGYMRIDAKGWFTGDKYASSEQIASVAGDEVTLTVTKDALEG